MDTDCIMVFDALAKLEEYGRVLTPKSVTLHESRGKKTVVFEYGETGRANVDVTKAASVRVTRFLDKYSV